MTDISFRDAAAATGLAPTQLQKLRDTGELNAGVALGLRTDDRLSAILTALPLRLPKDVPAVAVHLGPLEPTPGDPSGRTHKGWKAGGVPDVAWAAWWSISPRRALQLQNEEGLLIGDVAGLVVVAGRVRRAYQEPHGHKFGFDLDPLSEREATLIVGRRFHAARGAVYQWLQ
jgi:hypothetical protein